MSLYSRIKALSGIHKNRSTPLEAWLIGFFVRDMSKEEVSSFDSQGFWQGPGGHPWEGEHVVAAADSQILALIISKKLEEETVMLSRIQNKDLLNECLLYTAICAFDSTLNSRLELSCWTFFLEHVFIFMYLYFIYFTLYFEIVKSF